MLSIVAGELDRLAQDGVTARELAVAKGGLRAETLLSHEDSGARMNRLGSSLLLQGEVKRIEEVLARVEAVDAAEVRAVAERLAAAPRTLAAVGPFGPDAFDPVALGLAGRAA